MTYRYGTRWNIKLQQPIDEISERAAEERAFQDWISVTRLPESGGPPLYTVEVGPEAHFVKVYRYDAVGSVVEVFAWREVSGESRLFFDNYKTWVYREGVSDPQSFMYSVAHKAWVFFQDGTATCRESIKGMPEAKVTRYRDLDMSGHWRERPVWGGWDRFGEHPEPD